MLSILVVDDSLFQRRTISKTLEALGHTVTEAPNGEVALRLIEEQNFDLITTDIMMPTMDGLEFIKQLKINKNNTPTLIISSSKDLKQKQDCISHGALGFIQKPIDGQEELLTQLINEHIKVAS